MSISRNKTAPHLFSKELMKLIWIRSRALGWHSQMKIPTEAGKRDACQEQRTAALETHLSSPFKETCCRKQTYGYQGIRGEGQIGRLGLTYIHYYTQKK